MAAAWWWLGVMNPLDGPSGIIMHLKLNLSNKQQRLRELERAKNRDGGPTAQACSVLCMLRSVDFVDPTNGFECV